jgi:AcrR family transcriptional regulator
VRGICKRAGANVAAVNYHFGGKDELYAAAVNYAHDCAKRYSVDEGLPSDPTPQQRLRGFVRAFLLGLLEEGKPAWHGKLMAREMAEPSAVLEQIAAEGVRPRFNLLMEILRSIVGPDLPELTLRRCGRSIVGQMLFYHFARPMLVRLFPDERLDASAVDALTDHIVAFSMNGLSGVAGRGEARAAARAGNGEP